MENKYKKKSTFPKTINDKRKPLSIKSGSFALFLSTIWSGNPVATKAGLLDCEPLRYGYLRFFLGGIINLSWAIATRKSFKLKMNEIKPLFLLGLLFTAQIAFLNFGQDFTTAGHGAIMISTFPLWTSIFAHIFVPNDKLSKIRLIGTFIAYSGVVIVFSRALFDTSNMNTIFIGDFFLIISAILLGLRQIYISQLGQIISQHKLLIAQSVFGIIFFVIGSIVFENSEKFFLSTQLIVSLFYTGIIIAGLAFIGQTWLLKNYLPSRVTILSLSQPIFGIFFSWIILGESIGFELYLGAILVFFGSFLAQKNDKTN